MLLHSTPFKKQTGAALLALMLVLIIGSSYFLVTKLNTNLALTRQSEETGIALSTAKNALIGYAITFPDHDTSGVVDGPGYLPCPDLDGTDTDNRAASNCSAGGNTTIGRLPNQTLRLEELRDASGQRLWYALSENFRFGTWKTIPLNSESPSSAELSVNGTDDIVAIIFAPGAPVGTQNRDPDEADILLEIANYLEDDNADLDTSFVTNANVDFNDRLVVITRQELMEAVEKRVLGEARMMLTNYFNDHGAYPWLTPFADPKASMPPLSGVHDGGNDAATLSDSSRDFNVWGVSNGDVVRNITDGSIGTVTAVAATTLTIAGGLSLGTENDFDDGDEYYIYPAALAGLGQLRGIATNANDNDSLEDTNNDFNELDITPGDIVDNLTDGSSGVVDSVSANELTFITLPNTLTLSGGTDNDFDNGDNYRIRSQQGQATAGTSNLTLEDTNNNFTVMGIQIGDLIVNITDGSTGRVSNVAANTLTIDDLKFGSDNIFEVNDYYSLPRYNADNNTREGLLTFHEVGETFKTALNFEWAITANAGDITVSNSTILQNYMQNYAALGSETFDDSIGVCIWLQPNIVDCYAGSKLKDFVNISGTLTSGSDTVIITDTTAEFNTKGIKLGDIAQNYDDEDPAFVFSGTMDAANSGIATAASNNLILVDTSNDFLNISVSVGDTIFNITDNSSGTIQSILANEITVISLSGGTNNTFTSGDSYQIGNDPILYDASADFSVYEPYSYVIQNNTLEIDLSVARIQGIISDIIDANTLVAVSYVGQDSTPIEFRVGDNYTIHQPYNAVVTNVSSETQLSTDNYTSALDPDFDSGEYYRVMPAANSYSGTVTSVVSTGTPDRFRDASANFLTEGISIGDIIENTTTGAFGEIIAVITDGIETTLYNGTPNDFTVGDSYTVYHDYVYSREHLFIHAQFRGDQATNTVSRERVRDVCLGYEVGCIKISGTATANANGLTLEDDTTVNFIASGIAVGDYITNITDGSIGRVSVVVDADNLTVISLNGGDDNNFEEGDTYEITFPNPVSLSDYGGDPFTTVVDYEEDETTEVGRATFTPTSASSGSIRVSNIDYYLWQTSGELPDWFITNKWYQLVYFAYSAGDSPNGGATCTVGTDCLTLTGGGTPNNNKRVLVVSAGEPLSTQDRTSGITSGYYENENNDAGDDDFQTGAIISTFNDQVRILDTSP